MKRTLFLVYGVVCYLIFFVTFLYAIGFLADRIVPKTVDAGFQGGSQLAWPVDLLLLSLFAVQHSVMARQGFKRWWTRTVPKTLERSTYVLFSSVALILLFYFWRPIDFVVWNARGTVLGTSLIGIYFLGWFIVLSGTFLINHFNLFGLQQVYLNLKRKEAPPAPFVQPLYYRLVRHPLMLGFIIAFWAAPAMTFGHLLFALASTGYILVGIQLEERDLVRFHGAAYLKYQQEVSQIIPMPRKKAVSSGAPGQFEAERQGSQ